jgi:hypothetical protein
MQSSPLNVIGALVEKGPKDLCYTTFDMFERTLKKKNILVREESVLLVQPSERANKKTKD